MMNRRLFLLGLAALSACDEASVVTAASPHVKRMAITMDDFNLDFDIGLSREARNENILEAFDAVNHQAAGFVTGAMVDSTWGQDVLKSWKDRGHLIENHTWSHHHANEVSSETYISDIEENDHFLSDATYDATFFRFPFLDDGKDRHQQEALFAGLNGLRLTNAPVTIDTIDWFTTSRLEARLREDPATDLSPYREYYVEMCVALANHWDAAARALGFASLPHLTLMHHNILNGHFLKDVLLALKADGWVFVDAAAALAFTPYHPIPNEPTHGRNWLTLKSRELDISVPPIPDKYSSFGSKEMDALGL